MRTAFPNPLVKLSCLWLGLDAQLLCQQTLANPVLAVSLSQLPVAGIEGNELALGRLMQRV
jgi:hypothetical protein